MNAQFDLGTVSAEGMHPASLQPLPRWVTWRLEARPKPDGTAGKPTKVPFHPATGRRAEADNPATWGLHAAAVALDAKRAPATQGGIGIELGDLGNGTALCGIDLDTCRDPETGNFTLWADEVIEQANTYAEVSPSGTGAKLYFLVATGDIECIRALLPPRRDKSPVWSFTWSEPGKVDHPPAIELHLGRRYFAWTGQRLEGVPDELRLIGLDFFEWLTDEAGPGLSGKPTIPPPSARERQHARQQLRLVAETATRGDTGRPIRTRIEAMIAAPRPNDAKRLLAQRWAGDWTGVRDTSGSGLAFALAHAVKNAGFCRQDVLAAVREHSHTAEWAAGADKRQLDRLFDRTPTAPEDDDRTRLPVTENSPEKVVDEIAKVLAGTEHIFDRGVPVTLSRDAGRGALRIEMMSADRTVTEIHRAARPFYYVLNKETGEFKEVDCEMPVRFASRYLAESTESRHLRPLNGTTSAPLLHEDGSIHAVEGYDPATGLWCYNVPDIAMLVPATPTRADAERALRTLREPFRTFCFADAATIEGEAASVPLVDLTRDPGADESAFLVALLTAVCRASLHLAPAILITAPALSGAGAGKGLLVRCIAAIAFGTTPSAITAGGEAAELEKRVAASLMAGSAMLFLDNVNGVSLKSALLESAITERPCEMRLLGASKIVKLNPTTLICITGNGLSVSEDSARRYIEIGLDAHVEDPESRPFTGDLLQGIRTRRAELLAAALTIWRWGRLHEASIPAGQSLGSFDTWSTWVRDPLLALGCRDPAERIAAAKQKDQRRQQVAEMLATWWRLHADRPTIASELHEDVKALLDPHNRGRQFQAGQLGKLTETRVGGYVLRAERPKGKWSPTLFRVESVPEFFQRTQGLETIGGHREASGSGSESSTEAMLYESDGDPYATPYATPMPSRDQDGTTGGPPMPNPRNRSIGGGIGASSAEENNVKAMTYDVTPLCSPMTPYDSRPAPVSEIRGNQHADAYELGGEL